MATIGTPNPPNPFTTLTPAPNLRSASFQGLVGNAAVMTPPASTSPAQPTPQTTGPTGPTPATPTATPTPTGPSGPSADSVNAASIISLINGAAKPNELNQYYQSTYHIRLFVAPDMDILSQSKKAGSGSSTPSSQPHTQPSIMQDMNSFISTVSQVTIAETGVTGFNIRDMTITTINSGNDKTQNSTGTIGTITITEPNGISFLDGLAAAATQLRIYNFLQASYYLEVTFKGYDSSGQFVNSATGFSTGGRWTWAIRLGEIQAKLNEGGGVYTVAFVCTNQTDGVGPGNPADIMVSPQPFTAVGDTVGALFTDYLAKLNTSWVKQIGGPLIVFDGIDTKAVGKFFPKPTSAAGMDPKTFHMKSLDVDRNPIRSWTFDSASGAYSVGVTPAYRVQDFIVDAIKHTIEGQAMAKDNDNVANQVDASPTTVNSRGHRESIIWSVETMVTQEQYDTSSGNYVKHIMFYVVPHYAPWAIGSQTQIAQSNSAAVQQDTVQSQIDNGFLRKRYDYVFTGLNTEIIDFDMSFRTNVDLLSPVFSGANMKYESISPNGRTVGSGTAAVDGNAEGDTRSFTPAPLQPGSAAPTTPSSTPVVTPTPATGASGVVGNAAVKSANTAASTAGATGPTTPLPPLLGNYSAGNVYVEDLLNGQTNASLVSKIPLSFWQHKGSEQQSPSGVFVGQYNRDESIVGAIWAQCLLGNGGAQTSDYMKIKLTIRGDPYWLGQTNIHRQLNLVFGNVAVTSNDLPDWSTGSQVIFLYFRYPFTTGDDFKPNLTSSQIFSGLYRVNTVTHYFADGVFKQELTCTVDPLSNLAKWSGTDQNNGGAASAPTAPTAPASTVAPFSAGAATGLT